MPSYFLFPSAPQVTVLLCDLKRGLALSGLHPHLKRPRRPHSNWLSAESWWAVGAHVVTRVMAWHFPRPQASRFEGSKRAWGMSPLSAGPGWYLKYSSEQWRFWEVRPRQEMCSCSGNRGGGAQEEGLGCVKGREEALRGAGGSCKQGDCGMGPRCPGRWQAWGCQGAGPNADSQAGPWSHEGMEGKPASSQECWEGAGCHMSKVGHGAKRLHPSDRVGPQATPPRRRWRLRQAGQAPCTSGCSCFCG